MCRGEIERNSRNHRIDSNHILHNDKICMVSSLGLLIVGFVATAKSAIYDCFNSAVYRPSCAEVSSVSLLHACASLSSPAQRNSSHTVGYTVKISVYPRIFCGEFSIF